MIPWNPVPLFAGGQYLVEPEVDDAFPAAVEFGVLHQELPDLAAFVSDGRRAIRTRLQQQRRVADSAGGHDHRLGWTDRNLTGGLRLVFDVSDSCDRRSRVVGVERDDRASRRHIQGW